MENFSTDKCIEIILNKIMFIVYWQVNVNNLFDW